MNFLIGVAFVCVFCSYVTYDFVTYYLYSYITPFGNAYTVSQSYLLEKRVILLKLSFKTFIVLSATKKCPDVWILSFTSQSGGSCFCAIG